MEIWREVSTWFLVFLVYSAVGWILEVIITLFLNHRFTNRGFLIGPFCPIYGLGGVAMTLILSPEDNPLHIFCVVMLLCAIIEYSASYIMEKLFHARWWDYSNQPFNLNGRICLFALSGFSLMGILAVKVVSPFLFSLLGSWNDAAVIGTAAALAVVLLLDFVVSLRLIIHFRSTTRAVKGDATEEITEYIRRTFSKHGRLSRRLLQAFPAMKVQKTTGTSSSQRSRKSRRSSK